MPRFPGKEAEIVVLAKRMIAGLRANPAIFPNPPFPPIHIGTGIRWKVRQYKSNRQDLITAHAVAEQATTDKTEALEILIEALKDDIRYAENTVNFDDDKLKLIGWAGKKAKTPLTPPGQTRLLEVPKQGKGWLFLDWKPPADGGKVGAYKVQRRVVGVEPVSDRWEDVATAILTESTLVEQPEKTELEYRVIAVNKAGEGQVSNTVIVVL